MGAPGTTKGERAFRQLAGNDGLGYISADGHDIMHAGVSDLPASENIANAHEMAASGVLYDALVKARDQFLFYEQSHLAKYPPWELEMLRKGIVDVSMGREAYEKAQVNADMAAACDAALARARGEKP